MSDQLNSPSASSGMIGILAGIILVLVAFYLIFWSEGIGLRGVKPARIGGYDIVVIPNAPVDIANNNKLIYTHGAPVTNAVLQDPLFGFSEKVIKLVRKVEMYQWSQSQESKKEKLDDGTEKEPVIYNYRPVWSTQLIDSNTFKDSVGHRNPLNIPLDAVRGKVQDVTIGDFHLSPEFIDKMTTEIAVDLSKLDLTTMQQRFKMPVHHDGMSVFIGENPKAPAVGDLRVSLFKIMPLEISVIALQSDTVLRPFALGDGKPVAMIVDGNVPANVMVHRGQSGFKYTNILLPIISLLIMLAGAYAIISHMSKMANVNQMLAQLIGAIGANLVIISFGLGLWSLGTMIAWLIVKPMWAAGLLFMISLFYLLVFKLAKARGKEL